MFCSLDNSELWIRCIELNSINSKEWFQDGVYFLITKDTHTAQDSTDLVFQMFIILTQINRSFQKNFHAKLWYFCGNGNGAGKISIELYNDAPTETNFQIYCFYSLIKCAMRYFLSDQKVPHCIVDWSTHHLAEVIFLYFTVSGRNSPWNLKQTDIAVISINNNQHFICSRKVSLSWN